jgi:diguanylate cyclase (GGDEF)-like protein
VRAAFRAEDAVARFAGEEFVVLVVEATPEQLAVVAERVRARISACEGVPGASGVEVGRLTASVGAACYPSAGDDLDGLVAAADSALLDAKRAGRDCVRVAG